MRLHREVDYVATSGGRECDYIRKYKITYLYTKEITHTHTHTHTHTKKKKKKKKNSYFYFYLTVLSRSINFIILWPAAEERDLRTYANIDEHLTFNVGQFA